MASKKPKFRRQFDPSYTGDPGIANDLPSLTVPSQALSLKQLLFNHAKGIHYPVKQYDGIYTGEMEVPKFNDLFDAMEYRKELQRKKAEVEKEISDLREADKLKKAKEAREKEKEALRAEIEAEKGPKAPVTAKKSSQDESSTK